MINNLTLVTGGAASGKSAFSERLVRTIGGRRHYLATAQAFDGEMRDKILRHQLQRGGDWITHEAPLEVDKIIENLTADDVLLLDCATLWLTNLMLAEHDVSAAADGLLRALSDTPAQVVIVTNEVGSGIVPQDALSRQFRQFQGELNQNIAANAALVVVVISGLPMILKGQMPEGFQ